MLQAERLELSRPCFSLPQGEKVVHASELGTLKILEGYPSRPKWVGHINQWLAPRESLRGDMAALLDPRRVAVGQPPELQPDARTAESSSGKAWNPLVVPREVYQREGLAWNSHQPVSLTVEVNGKRDLTKYAAVMQLVGKVGFVARLGQPGAAAKFQNLHLLDVKRRGSTDIHITLGDLAWAQSRASEISTTIMAPVAAPLPPAASVSPDCSDIASGAADACVLSGGAAEGGVVSGSSSEGTSTHPSSASVAPVAASAAAAHLDAGTSTDTQSHGDVGSDHDEKNTVNSAAPASTADGADVGRPLAVPLADAVVGLRCGCAFCPCNLDPQELAVSPGDIGLLDTCVGQQMACDRSISGCCLPGAVGGLQNCLSSPPTGPAADPTLPAGNPSGGGPPTHISRERLRNLCLPSMLKPSIPAIASKAASGTAQGRPTGSLPGLNSPPKLNGADAADAGVESAADMRSEVTVIGCELPLPTDLAAKLGTATHVLVQYEIDGELADCKMQYRLALSADGCSKALTGVSAPLRGLQLLHLGEAPCGELFIRASSISSRPTMEGAGFAASGPDQQVGRSSRGRTRRPSLKARECPEGRGVAAAMASGPSARGKAGSVSGVPALPPLYPQTSAFSAPDGTQPNLAQKTPGQAKRRGRTHKALPLQQSIEFDDEQYAAAQDGLAHDSQDNGCEHGRKIGSAKRPRLAGKSATLPLGSDDDSAALLDLATRAQRVAPIRRRRSVAETAPASVLALAPADRRASAPAAMPAPLPPSGRSRQPRSRKGSVSAAAASADDSPTVDQDDLVGDGYPTGAQAHIGPDPSGRVSRKRENTATRDVQHAGHAPSSAMKRQRIAKVDAESDARRGGARALELLRRSATEELLPGLASGMPHPSPQGSEAAVEDPPTSSAHALVCVPDVNAATTNGRHLRARRPVRYTPDPGSCSESPASDDSDGNRAGRQRSASSDGAAGTELATTMDGEDNNPLAIVAVAGPGGAAPQARSMSLAIVLHRPKPRARSTVNKSKNKPIRHPSKITNVVRNAGAILLMIGRSPMMYEKQLRATFGNNPDTSKALRLLEEQGKVVRGGLGYRMHPYHYTLTPGGLEEYDRLLAEQGPSHAFALTMGVQLPASEGAIVVAGDPAAIADGSNALPALPAGVAVATAGAAGSGGANGRGMQGRRVGEQAVGAQGTTYGASRATTPQAAAAGTSRQRFEQSAATALTASDGAIVLAQPNVGGQASAAQQTGAGGEAVAPAEIAASAAWYGWPAGMMGAQHFCFPGYSMPAPAGNSTSDGGHQPASATGNTPATSSTSAGANEPLRGGAQTAYAKESSGAAGASAGPPPVFVHPTHPFMGPCLPGPPGAGHVAPPPHLTAYQHAALDAAKPPGEPGKQYQTAATCQTQGTQHHPQQAFTMYGYVPTPYGYMPCAMFNPFPAAAPTANGVAGSSLLPPHVMPFLPPQHVACPGAPMSTGNVAPGVGMSGPMAFATLPHYPSTMAFPPGAPPAGPINTTTGMHVLPQQGLMTLPASLPPSHIAQSHVLPDQSSNGLEPVAQVADSVTAGEDAGPGFVITDELPLEQPPSQTQQVVSSSNDVQLKMEPVSTSLADSTDASADPTFQVDTRVS